MEYGKQPHLPAADAGDLRTSPHLADRCRVATEKAGGEVSKGHDDGRINDPELAFEPGRAVCDLLWLRVAVLGRAALEHVRNEHLFPGQPYSPEERVEKAARRPHEGKPLPVLTGAGSLTDEHERCVGRPASENDLGP